MKNAKEKLKEIYGIVSKLSCNEDSILDVMNYLDMAINIAKFENPDRYNNPCLNNLLQTREKQLNGLKNNFEDKKNREFYFNELKYNFLSDISLFGFLKYPKQEE